MSIPWDEPPQEEVVITMSIPWDDDMYNLRKELFKAAMNQNWIKVLELYKNKQVQGQHITRANDTLLHVAISGAKEKTVLDLLNIIQDNEGITTLYNRNHMRLCDVSFKNSAFLITCKPFAGADLYVLKFN